MAEPANSKGGFIDTKIPVTWLLTTSGGLIIALIGIAFQFNTQANTLSNKMDVLIGSNSEMKARLNEREVKYDTLRDSMYALQRLMDAHDLRLTAVERAPTKGR